MNDKPTITPHTEAAERAIGRMEAEGFDTSDMSGRFSKAVISALIRAVSAEIDAAPPRGLSPAEVAHAVAISMSGAIMTFSASVTNGSDAAMNGLATFTMNELSHIMRAITSHSLDELKSAGAVKAFDEPVTGNPATQQAGNA